SSWPGRIFLSLLIWALFTSWLPSRVWLSVFQAGIFILVCHWLRVVLRRNIPLSLPWPVAAILLLPCFGILQLVLGTSVYAWKTAVATLDFAALAAVAWLSYQYSATAEFRQAFLRFLVVVGLISAVLAVLHWNTSRGLILWTWPDPYQAQVTFPLLNHSHLAALL